MLFKFFIAAVAIILFFLGSHRASSSFTYNKLKGPIIYQPFDLDCRLDIRSQEDLTVRKNSYNATLIILYLQT